MGGGVQVGGGGIAHGNPFSFKWGGGGSLTATPSVSSGGGGGDRSRQDPPANLSLHCKS